jgi:L-seryl-tRNA(Ser) seleniumtransferase
MKDLLRKIPKVDDLLKHAAWKALSRYPAPLAKDRLREVLDRLRAAVTAGSVKEIPPAESIIGEAERRTAQFMSPTLKKVVNGTGVIIHTNLGRSPLAASAVARLAAVASGYSNLEYDLAEGGRGDRYSHCLSLLLRLTGAESALIVNNNAAAVLLTLNTLALGREVIISRGELIEIGGAFRIPEVMERSGAILREVGTTNRTFIEDYEQAAGERTALIMKAHTSNYRIRGFVHEATSAELAGLAASRSIPFYFDAGSGLISDPGAFTGTGEPRVPEEAHRADVISFSGDKLLGGPQAGILLGKAHLIEAMKRNPLTRALRPDKFTLAAMEATLLLHLDSERAGREIPVLRMLHEDAAAVRRRAVRIVRRVKKAAPGVAVEVVKLSSEVGGGSLPDVAIPSWGISFLPARFSVERLERAMRELDVPVIGRIEKGRFLIDARTVQEEDETYLPLAVAQALRDGR